MLKKKALENLKLSLDKKTLLILGGSQGSLFINNTIKTLLESNAYGHKVLQIIHQTGKNDTFDWQHFYSSKNIRAFVCAYTHSIENFYLAADLIICRAGAGTLFEALFFKKLCIVIPLQTTTNDHQVYNAQALAAQHPELITIFYHHELTNFHTILYEKLKI